MTAISIREKILELLDENGDMTTEAIALATGTNNRTVASILSDMHKKLMVHIKAWHPIQSGKRPAAIWAAGESEDAEYTLPREPADRLVLKSLQGWAERCQFGPFATAMWNVSQGERP